MERTRKPSLPGEILKEMYLDPLGLTITDFAERIGVSRKTVSAIVNGRSPVTVDMALRLSRAFSTTPDLWLDLLPCFCRRYLGGAAEAWELDAGAAHCTACMIDCYSSDRQRMSLILCRFLYIKTY